MNTRLSLLLGSAGLVALAGCVQPDPYATTSPNQRAQTGAIAGAVLGGVYGMQRDSDRTGKLADVAKGAALGAALGGLGGAIMDAQAQALQQSIQNPNVTVTNHGQYVQVSMPEGILFATNSAVVGGNAQRDLRAVAQNLIQYPNTRAEVIGHTDSTGAAAYNMDLSQRRANSVANVLISNGVPAGRIAAVGRGASQPVASNDTVAGRAQNRRVDIIIRPLQ